MAARMGTVCGHCWHYWRQQPGHDAAKCKGEWDDHTSPNGWAVCMCGCKREDGAA